MNSETIQSKQANDRHGERRRLGTVSLYDRPDEACERMRSALGRNRFVIDVAARS